jgi:AcrR family transcriptional regulator
VGFIVVARIVDKDQKRRDIARAAMGVFSERGFDATSMNLVAGAAGVGKGTIYEYFDSKDEMISAAILIWIEDIIEGARSLSQRVEDPEQRLRTFVSETMAEFTRDQSAIRTTISVFQVILSNLDNNKWFDPVQSAFKDIWKTIVQIIMDGHYKGVFKIDDRSEAEKIAINLVAFLDGICLHYYATGGQFDIKGQVDHYMKYLLEASLKRTVIGDQ